MGRLRIHLTPLAACVSVACTVLLVLAGHAATARAASPPPRDSLISAAAGHCGICHPGERVSFLKSGHASEGVTCVSCHGGDATSTVESVAHGGSFRRHLQRAQIPPLCASCHADQRLMRPYGLPVDQYALYQTSAHGKRLAAGDTRVAVCSDCHGVHDILSPSDPASRVATRNIPRTCGTCHPAGTAEGGGPHARAYADYQASVHAVELLERDNPRAPTCVSCHGVHGAAPQAASDVGTVCGQCHTQERRALLSGPHATALAEADLPECASCHTAHAIRPASPRNLATICAKCHEGDTRIQTIGRQMWTAYASASAQLDRAEALVARADQIPINTEDYKARLAQARTYLREALPAAHAVRVEPVTALTTRARSIGVDLQAEVNGQMGHLAVRRYGLVLFWFYIILTLVILRRFRRASR
jgi:hypothetical protein